LQATATLTGELTRKSSVHVAGFSLQHGHYSKPATPNLQHTTN